MGMTAAYNRRRRRASGGRHALIGGRTGSLHFKKRRGIACEVRKHGPRAWTIPYAGTPYALTCNTPEYWARTWDVR
jgi:hypothetical protein